MKIAVVVSSLTIRGGTHKQVLRLVEYLTKMGEDVVIYTKRYDPAKTFPEFMNYRIVQSQNTESEKGTKKPKNKIVGLIKSYLGSMDDDKRLLECIPKDVDIINMHDNNMRYLFPAKRKRYGAKTVWQINDLPLCFQVGAAKNVMTVSNPVKRSFDKFLNRWIAKKCDRITVNVTKNKERVIENLKCDADVFYCGVDKNESLEKHEYPEQKGTIRLLSTGVFFPYRNYESLVLAVERLSSHGYDVRIDIIGSTELDKAYADKVTEMIVSKGLGDKITVWGQVDEDKYNELYNRAHMFLFLNIDQSWGLAVFEAMSCGLPVIVSNSVGAIELLHHNEDSVIIEPKDIDLICQSVIKLAENKEFYEKLSVNAMNAVEEFTWDKLYSEKMLNLFKKLHDKK